MPSSVKKPQTKRQELGARSRDEIIDAAENIMSLHGYDGASVSRIAAASGLPSSSIYWHFGSKSGVLAAVMERGADRFFAETEEVPDRGLSGLAPRDALRRVLGFAQKAVEDNPEFLRILYLLTLSGVNDEAVMSHVREVRDRGKRELHRVIEQAFAYHGELLAHRIADELVDFSQAVFDGAFLTTQAHSSVVYSELIDHMADSLIAQGDVIAASGD
jgi:AcrR family transcriptional regulator